MVSINQAHAQSLTVDNLDDPKASQSAAGSEDSSQSGADANSSSNLDNVRSRVENNEGFNYQLEVRDDLSTVPSSTIDILNNLGNSPEFLTSQFTEVEGEHNPKASTTQVNEPQEQNQTETSISSLLEGTEGSVLENSASLSPKLINNNPSGTSTSLVTEPTVERIPESSPSLLVWLGLAGVGLLHARARSKKAGGRM
ncbi:MAG: hypothetical protein F6K31_23845 [Symploca sp. SIO2G7]|nr:hypothetical protein [Symploca sp. SIO2G7]